MRRNTPLLWNGFNYFYNNNETLGELYLSTNWLVLLCCLNKKRATFMVALSWFQAFYAMEDYLINFFTETTFGFGKLVILISSCVALSLRIWQDMLLFVRVKSPEGLYSFPDKLKVVADWNV